MIDRTLLYEASMAWTPDFPRRATYSIDPQQHQVETRPALIDSLTQAAKTGGPGYASVYSFPNGHSQDGNIPKIDTVFFDLDIPSGEGEYDPQSGGKTENWRRDMSKLLVRARMIANVILDEGLEDHIRVAYSGHKGIHLYVDFPALDYELGPLQQYKNGIDRYADELIDFFAEAAGIEVQRWVDVTSHDMGRLARVPNTPHTGAKHVDWTPFCVAGSVEELASMTPDKYLKYTEEPRELPDAAHRTPSENAHDVITQKVLRADASASVSSPGESSYRNDDVLEQYRAESNDSITPATVRELLVKNKPCINAWLDRDDAYKYGTASREMEINVIKEFAKHEVPIDVMVELFRDIPRFDEDYSRSLIKDVIARYHPSSFVCRNVVNNAPDFCLGESCHIYQRSDDLEK